MKHCLSFDLYPGVSHDEIKKLYKELGLKYHPCKNPSGRELFEQLNKSYKN